MSGKPCETTECTGQADVQREHVVSMTETADAKNRESIDQSEDYDDPKESDFDESEDKLAAHCKRGFLQLRRKRRGILMGRWVRFLCKGSQLSWRSCAT